MGNKEYNNRKRRKRTFCENQYTKKETKCFSENNNITLNKTECRSSVVEDANKSNQSDNESHKYSSTSFKKLKVSLDSYQNQSMNEDYDNNCNISMGLGI